MMDGLDRDAAVAAGMDPDRLDALAAMLDRLDRPALRALGEAGHARYLAAFDEDRATRALDDAYDLALARRARR